MSTKKVGVLTFHNKNNYGAVLQSYALLKVIEKLNYEPVILDRFLRFKDRLITDGFKSSLKQSIALNFENFFLAKGFKDFRKKEFKKISKPIKDNSELTRAVNDFHAIIVGSDQVWRVAYAKSMIENYFLDFVPDDVRKIAYAASFGIDSFEGGAELTKTGIELLKRFHAISAREDTGVDICRKHFNIKAFQVLDPTLLLTGEQYELLIDEEKNESGNYVAEFLLDATDDKRAVVQKIASLNNCDKITNITRAKKYVLSKPDVFLKDYKFPSVSSWLSGIMNADFVVTDSFHGVAFSILFNKQFVCIQNSRRGISRIQSLFRNLSIDAENALLLEEDIPGFQGKLKAINYDLVNQKLKEQRRFSYKFLYSSLK